MSNIYCIKTGKRIIKDKGKRNESFYSLKVRDYTLRIVFECPKGHLFYEEWHQDKLDEFGTINCLETSVYRNENVICPECLKNSKD